MLPKFYRCALTSALVVGSMFTAVTHAHAQAIPTLERGAELAPFALGTSLSPDWGQTRNPGYTVGIDYTRFLRGSWQPAVEFRYAHADGRTVAENTYLGGLKLQTVIHGVHPYALLLAGIGVIHLNYFNNGYNSDNASVYAFGGGADFDIARGWKLKADFVSQHWNLDPATLTPSAVSVGIAYRLPFGTRNVR